MARGVVVTGKIIWLFGVRDHSIGKESWKPPQSALFARMPAKKDGRPGGRPVYKTLALVANRSCRTAELLGVDRVEELHHRSEFDADLFDLLVLRLLPSGLEFTSA